MSKKKHYPLVLVFLILFVGALMPAAADDEQSIISIDSAQKTEYKKDPVNGGDCIILTGGVQVSVSRGSNKTTITADMVNYNRKTEMLYAEGNVSLSQSGSNAGGEAVTAHSLLFNTFSLEGIFDNGRIVQTQSDALNLPSGSKLNVASSIFGRDSSNTIAFKSGELTFCDDEDPHWKIKATRIWLLPGGEFAFFNAFLYVGHVPLLYFPAFYYPKDELLFNPAFGYRAREGYFINTTTYVFGRKPQDAVSTADLHSSSSDSDSDSDKLNFFSLMKTGSLKEQRREGLVLHNLDADFKGNTTNYLKVMGDYYSNLGAMAGLDGVYKPGGYITDLEGKLQLGFSNTIFESNGTYLPYSSSGETYQDGSNFMGTEFPFRYHANLKFTLAKPFSLTLAMPLYSDPYVNYDFNTRAETMDWIDFLMSGSESDDEDSVTEISSFTWQLSGSYTPKLNNVFENYLSSLSVSSFKSSILFTSLSNTSSAFKSKDSEYQTYSPERKFYYPSQITPLTTTIKFAGTLFQYPKTSTAKKTSSKLSVSLVPPPEFDSGDEDEDAADADTAADEEHADGADEALDAEPGENAAFDAPPPEFADAALEGAEPESAEDAEEDEKDVIFSEAALPLIATSIPSATTINSLSYKLSYSVTPTFTSQFTYSSSNLTAPEDFAWSDVQATYYQVKAPTVLTSSLGYRDSFITLTDTFTFSPVYQEHPYLNEDYYTESSINSLKKTDYNARKLDLTDVNALSFKPFYYTQHFSDTSLTWNTTVKMIRTQYISDDVENPEWEYLTTELWNSDCVTVHNLNLVLAAKEFDGNMTQKLSLTTTLPPQVDAYSGVLTLGFPYTTFSVGTGIKQKSATDDTWVKNDLSQSLAINLFNSKLKFTQSYIYDLEDEYHESFKLALSGYGAQLAYTMSYTTGYDFDVDNGWTVRSEKEFLPYSLSLAYVSGTKTWARWAERISVSPSLSTSVVYDYLRPTNSYFTFVPALTFKVNDFLNIKFSSESRNSVIYRYFQQYTGQNIELPGETDLWKDLMNSFDFTHEENRKASGFKLKSLSVSITHDLDDWDLAASFSVKPRLVTDASHSPPSYYDFSPYFSISVAWRPMQGMKTEIVDEYGEWALNP